MKIYIGQIGDRHEDFFELYAREVLPHFRDRDRSAASR
jgi:hypothetical protein